MFGGLFRKREKREKRTKVLRKPRKKPGQLKGLDKRLDKLSTKDDVERIVKEIASSRDAVLTEVGKIPDSVSNILVEQITSPLKDFISSELAEGGIKQLSINEAVKQKGVKQLSSNQAVKQKKSIDDVVSEMKERLEMLSQRHLKVLNILVQNREVWLDYEDVGKFCSPQLTGSCIRGYVADLINSYKIPVDKRNFGRKSKVKLSGRAVKQLAISKLVD